MNKRDNSRYTINNSIALAKNRFVLEFVKQYLNKNKCDFSELKRIFLKEYQGSTGVINELDFVEKKYIKNKNKRHFLKDYEILESFDNIKFVVSTEWNKDNVKNIVEIAKKNGFEIRKVNK